MSQSSKCLNYLGFQHCSEVSFVALLAVWTCVLCHLASHELVTDAASSTVTCASASLKPSTRSQLILLLRSYLNCQILWSVWNEFELIPIWNRTWQASVEHPHAWWLWRGLETGRVPAWLQYALLSLPRASSLTVFWQRYQIFAPIFLLQCVNGFWSYLLWRILWRLVVGVKIADIREEGETDEEEVEETKKDK